MKTTTKLTSAILAIVYHVSFIQCTSTEIFEYKVYDFDAATRPQADYHRNLTNEEGYDALFVRRQLGETTKIAVASSNQRSFKEIVDRRLITYNSIDHSLEAFANNDRSLEREKGEIDFKKYLRFDEINSYLDRLAKAYPKIVEIRVAGTSSEGRKMKTIHISHGGTENDVILIIGGIYAREWLSHASALYIIHHLVEKSEKIESFLKNFTWIILPVTNPDGYEYTHTSQRMWRKTRSPQKWGCYGVDANRNFGFRWGEQTLGQNPCDVTFPGTKPFTEPETRAVADLLESVKGRCTLFIDIHSFGGFIFLPWTYTEERISMYNGVEAVGLAGAKAIYKATGTHFRVGSLSKLVHPTAGSAIDYAMGEAGIPYALILELRGGGPTGFDPPSSQIKEIVDESWIGIKAMVERHKTSIRRFGVESCSRIERKSISYFHFLIIYFCTYLVNVISVSNGSVF